ncbi:MAG: diguanylate cyclase [Nannocystaceae bacterium]|nr:diguanylate cyclase [Nannocystaceae bacterium]
MTPTTPLNPPACAHVLVVDDDPGSAASIAATVASLGHRTTVCHGWTAALRAFGEQEVDLVLMDAVMPGVDGFRLTRLLRARASSYVPILFLTALADRRAREAGVAAGADDFLSKPVDPLELRMRMTAMLRIRWLTRDLEARTHALARLAAIDGLTGVGNRRSFDEHLVADLEHARVSGQSLALLMLDLDHFKRINDGHGHTVGDALLAFFGKLISQEVRSGDACYRFGGEEFAIVARGAGVDAAMDIGERVRRAFAQQSITATAAGPCSVSIGACATDQFAEIPDGTQLIEAADAALYRAKTLGRNCVVRADPHVVARVA